MPKLGVVETERLNLPSTENEPNELDRAWVVVKKTFSLGDIAEVNRADDETDKAIAMLASIITQWNFTDPEGNMVEPSIEWVRKLDLKDFKFLTEWIESNISDQSKGLTDEENFTSTATL